MSSDITFAQLAVEQWKLLRAFERVIATVSPEAEARFSAQSRYSASRLDTLLSQAGLRIVSFDGLPFETNLPAVVLNAEDVTGLPDLVVEKTVEPAVIRDMTVLMTGKVILAQSKQAEGA